MKYKLLCIKDTCLLGVSIFSIIFNIYVQPIMSILIIPIFFICWGGWEYWWSCGVTKHSLNYHKRAKLFAYKEVTQSCLLHSIICSFSDISISLSIINIAGVLIPLGLQQFNIYFLTICILLALFQNTLVTILHLSPVTNNMSWSPLAGNSDCEHIDNELQHLENIKTYIYALSFIFFIESIYNFNFYNLAIVLLLLFYYYSIITFIKLSTIDQYFIQIDEQINRNVYLVCWNNQKEWLYAICLIYGTFLLLKN